MKRTHISKRGLATIAVLVALLWSCVWGERLFLRKARKDLLQAARQVQTLKLRRVMVPANQPAAKPTPSSQPLFG